MKKRNLFVGEIFKKSILLNGLTCGIIENNVLYVHGSIADRTIKTNSCSIGYINHADDITSNKYNGILLPNQVTFQTEILENDTELDLSNKISIQYFLDGNSYNKRIFGDSYSIDSQLSDVFSKFVFQLNELDFPENEINIKVRLSIFD